MQHLAYRGEGECLGGTNNVISPVGKPDLLIVHIGVVPFGKKCNIKARQVITVFTLV